MKNFIVVLLLTLVPVSEVLAKQDYTYVKASLAFPWFMFFVFFALIMIPFFMVIGLAWRNPESGEGEASEAEVPQSSSSAVPRRKNRFNRIVLPTILIFVAAFSVLLVMNAYEAMDLMEHSGTAAPTMLNARP